MSLRSHQAQRLTQLVNHLITGALHIERQRGLIRDLERDGHNTQQARRTLKQMEELQAFYASDKDRLIAELAKDEAD